MGNNYQNRVSIVGAYAQRQGQNSPKVNVTRSNASGPKREVRREDMTESSLATIYGCCGLFDLCSDRDLISLTFQGADPFMDWLGWQGTKICRIKKNFITYIRPEMEGAMPTNGYVSDPCTPGNGVEWGTCDFTLEDFARLRRVGPVRDMTEYTLRLCEAQPRYRIDGTQINSDEEYDAILAAEGVLQDLRRMVIDGNATTTGQFDGLERLVKTGYTDSAGRSCQAMDSIVIDMNMNGMDGGAGVTWNGAAVAATYNFVDIMRAAIRRVWQRIRWSGTLGSQRYKLGDQVLLLPDFLAQCLLDSYTCWSVCPGVQFNEANINTLEARAFRDNLNGGLFGSGRIFIDGVEIPLLTYDWGLIKGANHGDIYFLTGSWGNLKLLQGQYLDMSDVPNAQKRSNYWVTDGGRFLHWNDNDQTCERHSIEIRPRLLSWAPWTNIRFQNVSCSVPGGPLSPDPLETSFYPTTSFFPAACPA